MTSTAEAQTGNQTPWQPVVSYGIGSWVVLQVAETLSSLIGLPLWFGQALLVLLLIGLAVLLGTSIVQGRSARGTTSPWSHVLTWKNTLRIGVGLAAFMTVVTVGYLGMRASGIGPVSTLQARGVFTDQERLILADFEDNGDDSDLAQAVTTLLRIDLAQSQAFTVLEPIQLAPVLARMRRDPTEPVTYDVALEAARREGIKGVVTGELVRAGSAIVISARIVTTSEGEVLVAVRETASDPSDVPNAVDHVSAQLRERVGESLRSIQGDPPLEEVTTSSMQALEKYAQAQRASDRGEDPRAIALLEEALVEDSLFAMAHRKVGILLQNRGLDQERSSRAFTRAWELRDRLSDRERWLAEAAYLTYVEPDELASNARYVTLLESYPTDRIALNNLALAYRALGRHEEAAELYLRSVRNGGAPATTFAGVIPLLYQLGDTAQARAMVGEFREVYPENPDASQAAISLLTAVFDYGAAEEAVTSWLEQSRGTAGEINARLLLGQIRLVQGRAEEGLTEFRTAIVMISGGGVMGIAPAAAEAVISGSVAVDYEEDPAGAIRLVNELWVANDLDELTSEQRQDLQFAGFFASAGDLARARELLGLYAAGREPGDLDTDGAWSRIQGLVALAEGRTDEAVASFHRGREENRDCVLCGLSELGSAFDAAAMPDSAIHYFERYLSDRDLGRLSNADNLGFWRVVPWLGELHAEHGDPDRARDLFTLFLDVTEEADGTFAPKRDRIRRSLAELNARGG